MISRQKRATVQLLLVLLALSSCEAVAAGRSVGPCEREIARVSQRDNVPVGVFYSVGLVESGHGGRLDPFAMNIEGKPYFASDLKDALSAFAKARARGARLIDIGCMQVNEHYHGTAFPSVAAMFDPVLNVAYASRFLRELRMRYGSWTLAAARYHAGPDKTAEQKRYVCQVAQRMVGSGLGAWTPAAWQFCH